MRADLEKLLALQTRDAAIADVEARTGAVRAELVALDAVLQQARASLAAAERAAAESARRCAALEAEVESHRAAQERRRQRLEQVRNPKEVAAAMIELDLAGAVQAKEEAEWVRSAELVDQQQHQVAALGRELAAAEAVQAPERAQLGERLRLLEEERAAALREREAAAEQVERALRSRYDRLRRSRGAAVVVPLIGSTFTSIPLNRRTQIRSGQAIDGCEACGAILYPPDGE